MHFKSKAYTFLKKLCNMIKTQFGCSTRHIPTDNGTKYLSHTMQLFFQEKSIIHERTCVETPQQNGVAERKHRHLLEVARSLCFQANLSLSFWGECILTTAYFINRILTPNLDGKSPHELLFKTTRFCLPVFCSHSSP